jgi:hypothetical protein
LTASLAIPRVLLEENQDILGSPGGTRFLDFAICHELGHAFCQESDEIKAERLGQRLRHHLATVCDTKKQDNLLAEIHESRPLVDTYLNAVSEKSIFECPRPDWSCV